MRYVYVIEFRNYNGDFFEHRFVGVRLADLKVRAMDFLRGLDGVVLVRAYHFKSLC